MLHVTVILVCPLAY